MTASIRADGDADWPAILPIVRAVVVAGDTYAYDPAWTDDELRAVWMERPPGRTVVAVEDGEVVGTAKLGPNRPGPGAHVATASFMVRSRRAARASAGPSASSSSPGPAPTATGRCSSTPSSR